VLILLVAEYIAQVVFVLDAEYAVWRHNNFVDLGVGSVVSGIED
jgi:hypothetical protein